MADLLKKWCQAVFGLAIFSAVITPTADAITMLALFVPMFGLYLFGVWLCWYSPPTSVPAEEEEVGV